MVCTKCNTRNNYFHSYCYQCGTLLKQGEVQQSFNGQVLINDGIMLNKQRETFNPYRDKRRNKRLLYSALISICILTVMVYWFFLR